jgi:hypothetical protein
MGFPLISPSNARELSTIDQIERLGMQVKMGELTGAGSRVSLSHLAGLVLPEGVVLKEDFNGIIVKNVTDPKISDIVKVKIHNQNIQASEFVGFVTH